MPRPTTELAAELRIQAHAYETLLAEVLARHLRAAGDPDAEGLQLITTMERRLHRDPAAERALVRQVVEAAIGAERTRRLAELANDGTP